LLRNFQKYAQRDVVERDSIWHWLSIAQHHNLPTRLLDWTFSPLVAAHFVTSDQLKMKQSGVIWAINFVRAQEYLPKNFQNKLLIEGANVFDVNMLSELAPKLETLEKHKNKFLLFFEPPSIDDRIVNQFALFSVMNHINDNIIDWAQKHPDLVHQYIIPAKIKCEIRDKLDQINLTERVLFPGLDGLSIWLKRHYSPRR
jgi:hypothetical protein